MIYIALEEGMNRVTETVNLIMKFYEKCRLFDITINEYKKFSESSDAVLYENIYNDIKNRIKAKVIFRKK